MAQQYSPAEWASQKDRVDYLYIAQRQTLEQVRDALEASGFIVRYDCLSQPFACSY
jgi:hypothetical protein